MTSFRLKYILKNKQISVASYNQQKTLVFWFEEQNHKAVLSEKPAVLNTQEMKDIVSKAK